MSCGYCSNSMLLCKRTDMIVCSDCTDSIKENYCVYCDKSTKADCDIYKTKPHNAEEIKFVLKNFFVENVVIEKEDIYTKVSVEDEILPLIEKIYSILEKEVVDEIEDLNLL